MEEAQQLKYKEYVLNVLVGKKIILFSPELLTIDDMEKISSKIVDYKKKYNDIMNENVFDDKFFKETVVIKIIVYLIRLIIPKLF